LSKFQTLLSDLQITAAVSYIPTSSSQILLALDKSQFALLMIKLADNLPDPLPIRQVRVKSYLPRTLENLLIPDDRTALYSSPELINQTLKDLVKFV